MILRIKFKGLRQIFVGKANATVARDEKTLGFWEKRDAKPLINLRS